jgi:hypothetical protein
LAENVLHNILPKSIEPADPDAVAVEIMTTIDDRLVSGLVGLQLRDGIRRHQIEEAA